MTLPFPRARGAWLHLAVHPLNNLCKGLYHALAGNVSEALLFGVFCHPLRMVWWESIFVSDIENERCEEGFAFAAIRACVRTVFTIPWDMVRWKRVPSLISVRWNGTFSYECS